MEKEIKIKLEMIMMKIGHTINLIVDSTTAETETRSKTCLMLAELELEATLQQLSILNMKTAEA